MQNQYFKPEFAAAGFNQGAITAFDNRGNSIYHGLAAELNRRFSAGLLFKAAYTWSKLIDDSTADLNSTSLAPRRAQDFYNMQPSARVHSLIERIASPSAAVWDVRPFQNSNWMVKNIIGNWMLGADLHLRIAAVRDCTKRAGLQPEQRHRWRPGHRESRKAT